jgi:hypothetical protein
VSTTVEDPEVVAKKTVNDGGQVYVGRQYADQRVRIVVELLDE